MNRGETLGPGQKKGGWTASKVMSEIVKQGYGFDEWYQKFGRAEGFAKGGITPVNLTSWAGRQAPFWTGEKGPELVVSPQSYGVLNNKDSNELMRTISVQPPVLPMPVQRSDGALRAEIKLLKEELKASRDESYMLMSQMIVALNNIRADTRSMDDMLNDGIIVKPEGGVQ